MFRRKSKTELIKDRAVEALETATEKARDAVADGAAKVEDVRKNSDAYAEVARAKAKKVRKEAAEAAEAARKDAKKAKRKAPKQDPAVLALAPKIDQGRDALVEDLLPKVAEGIAALAASATAARAAGDSLADHAPAAFAAAKGGKVKKQKKGGKLLMLVGLGLAGFAAYQARQKSGGAKKDPWAVPAGDPYTAPTSGRDSSLAAKATAVAEAAKEKVAAATGGSSDSTPTTTTTTSATDSASSTDSPWATAADEPRSLGEVREVSDAVDAEPSTIEATTTVEPLEPTTPEVDPTVGSTLDDAAPAGDDAWSTAKDWTDEGKGDNRL